MTLLFTTLSSQSPILSDLTWIYKQIIKDDWACLICLNESKQVKSRAKIELSSCLGCRTWNNLETKPRKLGLLIIRFRHQSIYSFLPHFLCKSKPILLYILYLVPFCLSIFWFFIVLNYLSLLKRPRKKSCKKYNVTLFYWFEVTSTIWIEEHLWKL